VRRGTFTCANCADEYLEDELEEDDDFDEDERGVDPEEEDLHDE
jgi:hypothetical protein